MIKIIANLLFVTIIYSFADMITPLPTTVSVDKKKATLGKELFFDKTLSRTEEVSCYSCHILSNGGADSVQFSSGVDGKTGDMNTPTVFNAVNSLAQFWNGRAKTLKEQIPLTLTNPVEMDMNLDDLVKKLSKTGYVNKFKEVYSSEITAENISDAIAEYMKTLITPNSPFDRYLLGDEDAISTEAKKGYITFKEQGCVACHQGVNVGGNSFQRFGSLMDVKSESKGRYEVTKDEQDIYYFKVPSLRNIELTAPYLHDGRLKTLEETVKFMANYQLAQSLSEEEINNIVSFLKSLTGQLYDYEE